MNVCRYRTCQKAHIKLTKYYKSTIILQMHGVPFKHCEGLLPNSHVFVSFKIDDHDNTHLYVIPSKSKCFIKALTRWVHYISISPSNHYACFAHYWAIQKELLLVIQQTFGTFIDFSKSPRPRLFILKINFLEQDIFTLHQAQAHI